MGFGLMTGFAMHDYTLQVTITHVRAHTHKRARARTHTLVSTVMSSLPLLGSLFSG
jgi:hypothetical protein